MQRRRREFEVVLTGELIKADDFVHVIVLNHSGESQVGPAELAKPAQTLHLDLEAIVLPTNAVVRSLESFETEANLDVRVLPDDWLEMLRVQAVGADLQNPCLRM